MYCHGQNDWTESGGEENGPPETAEAGASLQRGKYFSQSLFEQNDVNFTLV